MALWVFQNQQPFSKKDQTELSSEENQTESSSKETKPSPLHENIARQLSVLSTVEEWDDNISKEEEQDHDKEKSLESLKKKISEKLEK
jgi:hypothetical protein